MLSRELPVVGRRADLDMVKGFAILIMLLFHCMTENYLKTWISSFNMPIFFVICGIIHAAKENQVEKFKKILCKRCRSLMLPYLVWGLVLIGFFQLLNVAAGNKLTIAQQLFRLVTLQGIESMWFLSCYMIAELLFACLYMRLPLVGRGIGLAVMVLGLFAITLMGMPKLWILRLLIKIVVGLSFIYIGYAIERCAIYKKMHIGLRYCYFWHLAW